MKTMVRRYEDEHDVPAGGATRSGSSWLRALGGFGLVVAILFVAVVTVTFPAHFKKTDADVVALSYGGGLFEGRDYQGIHEPGRGRFFNGLFDKLYTYPATQRNYIISLDEGEGDRQKADSIVAPSKDGVPITYQMAVSFKLNTNEDTLVRFHEQLGLKYKAYGDGAGWDRLLNDAFRQQIENTTQAVSRRYTADQIYSDTKVVREIELAIGADLKDHINGFLGGDYFCGPTFVAGRPECPELPFTLKKADVPDEVKKSFEAIKVAQNRVKEKEQEVQQAKQEALALRERQAALAACPQCVIYEAVKNGKVTFWVLNGQDLTLQGPPTNAGP